MESLKRCVNKNGHNTFYVYLVGPNAPTVDDISLDIERMARLFEDLTKDSTKIDGKLCSWSRHRRRELEVRAVKLSLPVAWPTDDHSFFPVNSFL